MKSVICKIDNSERKRNIAIKETELFGYSCGLSKKQCLQLVLLSEELLGMAFSVLEIENGTLWLEHEDNCCKIFLQAGAEIGDAAKKRLLSASFTGEDVMHKGISGKILKVYEWLVGENTTDMFASDDFSDGMVSATVQREWSMLLYRKSVKRDEKANSWDELERSVLGKLADDVRVGLSSKKLKIVVEKSFYGYI